MAFLKPEAVRTVGRGPSVKWDNEFYYCDKLTWGTKVLIKSDTLDRGHVMCFTLDGAFIGEARTRAAIHALTGGKDEIRSMMARQRRQLKEARTCLADLTGGKHLYSPLELLLSDADAVGVKAADQVTSVKGAAHHYEHHQIPGVIDTPALPDSAGGPTCPTSPTGPTIAKENIEFQADMADFHAFITSNKEKDDYE